MELRKEQREAIPVLAPSPHLLLADVGAGKTATALRTLRARALLYGRKRTLVVGTKRICDSVWGQEIKLWAPEFTFASVAGLSAAKRQELLASPRHDIVAINFQNLAWAVRTFGEHLPRLFPQLLIDESSKLENPASKTFRAIKPLLPMFEWRLPMTGTPRANHLYDLWGNVYLADLGESLGEYREAFLQRWFYPTRKTGRLNWIPKPGAVEEIYDRVCGNVHRMPFISPDPIEQNIILPLNPAVAEINQRIDDALADGETEVTIDRVTYTHKGQRQFGKQLQLSSGLVYRDNKTVAMIHTDKLDALQEIVDEARGEPMMVVFQFDHERDAILKAFPQAVVLDSDFALRKWNAGEIEMLLVHPLSCGHGLNAQFSGSDLQVWFTPTSDAELYTQVVGRMNRPGATKTIRVIRLIMRSTKDMACYMVVAARQRGENATLEMFES